MMEAAEALGYNVTSQCSNDMGMGRNSDPFDHRRNTLSCKKDEAV